MDAKDLEQFTGTMNYYKHWTGRCKYTDGVHYVAEKAGAFWLIDAIVSYKRKEPFQIWTLKKNPDNSAVLTMQEDADQPIKVKQDFAYTDFPLDEIKFYLIEGVLILPSEY